jgi:hypothetical protein
MRNARRSAKRWSQQMEPNIDDDDDDDNNINPTFFIFIGSSFNDTFSN